MRLVLAGSRAVPTRTPPDAAKRGKSSSTSGAQALHRSTGQAQKVRGQAEVDGLGPTESNCAHSEQNADFFELDPEAAAGRLGSDLERGLSGESALERLRADGSNEIAERARASALRQFIGQFADVTVIALIVAALVAVWLGWGARATGSVLHRFGDAIAIGIIVLVNAIVGFAQQVKAERALSALRELGAPLAKVVRDGAVVMLPAREIVAGDLVELREGDRVPADARLVSTADLVVDESALTGESVPVDKLELGQLAPATPLAERTNMVFSGTHVARGGGRALVVATGMRSELGRIAALLGKLEDQETPLQKNLRVFGTQVVIGSAVLGAVVFAVGAIRLEASYGFLLLTAVSLAVAAIPEGLPAVTTIVLALGVQRMAKQNALVRRLSAVETLGAADVICTDKTGTLTENRMQVRRVQVGTHQFEVEQGAGAQIVFAELGHGRRVPDFSGRDPLGELVVSANACPAARIGEDGSLSGDPTDAAILRLWVEHRAEISRAERQRPTLRVLPFDRERKLVTVIVAGPDDALGLSHGAPEAVVSRSRWVLGDAGEEVALDDNSRSALLRRIDDWASLGLRVIALARTRAGTLTTEEASLLERDALLEKCEQELVLVGLVGIADPPRSEVALSLAKARSAGVRTIMITGDHPLTAEAIGRELAMLEDNEGEVITGPEIDRLDAAGLAARIERIRVVARATAAHKLRLVEALGARGHVVAMTGDGVNDAPAIKAADIGVAMGRGGTDVARESADMVLTDDNYATIVLAIEEGRIVYGNIKRFIVFLFSVNAGLVLAVLAAAAVGWPPILTPTQILWINLITNGLPALALGMEPVHIDPMAEPPRRRDAGLVDRDELLWLLAYGVAMAVLGVGTFAFFRPPGLDAAPEALALARTATFTVLAISPLFHALNARSRRDSVFELGFTTNWRLLGAFALALVLQAIAIYVPGLGEMFSTVPLPGVTAAVLIVVSGSVWGVGEIEKAISHKFVRKTQPLRRAAG